jgi:quinoprotein glucose dehydrogenase
MLVEWDLHLSLLIKSFKNLASNFLKVGLLGLSFHASLVQADSLSDRITFPESWKGEHFASNDLVNNPLSIAVDPKGRVYVVNVQTFRRGAEDARQLPDAWFVDEVQLMDLESRRKMNQKYENNGIFQPGHFSSADDKITWIEDRNGDGKAETKGLFADGFVDGLSGVGSSILHDPDGSVYYANIPSIWKVAPADEKGVTTGKESLVYGFGLRYGVAGHDLHGLEWGLDGRIYFSMGDRGFDIKSKEGKHFKSIDRGAVFRCEPDGSKLELICLGNRNPQDLEFDQWGRLFSVDNNRGRGDLSRLYEVIEGGDYAWYNGFENIKTFAKKSGLLSRVGPPIRDIWAEERSWDVMHDNQAYYVIPSLGTTMGGPAGLTMVPGESMGKAFENTFLFTNCRAGMLGFEIVDSPSGTSQMENWRELSKGGYFVDVDFDSEGRVYLADYVATGDKEGQTKGEIYRFSSVADLRRESVLDAANILKVGFQNVALDQLAKQLSHRDRRVRLGAQFELVRRGEGSVGIFSKVLKTSGHALARLHAAYGMGTLMRLHPIDSNSLLMGLKDTHSHVRAVSALMLGEAQNKPSSDTLVELLNDSHSRVRQSAVMAIGRIADEESLKILMAKVDRTKAFNPYVRSSMSLSLKRLQANDQLESWVNSSNKASRLMALLVYTRTLDSRVKHFLKDSDPTIVNEAIRSIERLQMKGLYGDAVELLSQLSGNPNMLPAYQIERLLYMAMRHGGERQVELMLSTVLNAELSQILRYRALGELIEWHDTTLVDPIFGQVSYRNPKRANLKPILQKSMDALLDMQDLTLLSAAIKLISKEGLKVDVDKLVAWTKNTKIDLKTRLSSFETLLEMKSQQVSELSRELTSTEEEELRFQALKYLAKNDPDFVMDRVKSMTAKGKDLRVTYRILPFLPTHVSYEILEKGFHALKEKSHPKDGCVELVDAIEKVDHKSLMAQWLNLSQNDVFHHQIYQEGGDPEKGKEIVMSHGTAQCTICHKVGRDGSGIVGPNLAQVGKKGKDYLTRALLKPSAEVAKGFGFTTLILKDGSTVVGTLLEEKNKALLMLVNQEKQWVNGADIAQRINAASSMPPMGVVLSKREIRDVLSYLNTLKPGGQKKKDH